MIMATMSLHAQKRAIKNRFNAGVVLGANTSQIDGDQYMGFDKTGFFVGARGIARIGEKSELVIEMLYNRKGSRDPNKFIPGRESNTFISLDYIEVPILFHRKIQNRIGVGSFEFGIAYAQLFGVRINEFVNNINYPSFTAIRDEFNNDDFSAIVGGGMFINKHIRIMGRIDYSLTFLFKNENSTDFLVNNPLEIRHLRNMQLGVGLNYIF